MITLEQKPVRWGLADTRTTVHKESQGHYNITGVSEENRLKHWKINIF